MAEPFPVYVDVPRVQDVLSRDAADTDGNAASDDEDAIAQAIVDAQNEIDAKLGAKYTVPFAPVPPLIASICQDIAAFLADLVFRENRDYQTDLSPIYLRYQRAQAMLGGLQTGELVIPPVDPENPEVPGTGIRVATVLTRPPLFCVGEFDIGCGPVRRDHTTPEGWAIH